MIMGMRIGVILVLLAAAAVCAPFLSNYVLTLAAVTLVYALFAISFDVVYGYGGMLSIGQALFFGIGAYAASFLIGSTETYLILVLLMGTLAAAIAASLVGMIAVHLKGPSFMMLSVIVSTIVLLIAQAYPEVTGGDDGIIIPASRVAASSSPVEPRGRFLLALSCFGIGLIVTAIIVSSPWGKLLRATKDNPLRSQTLGVDIRTVKLTCFIYGAALAGLAGCVNTIVLQHVDAGVFHVLVSIGPLIWSFFGGLGTLIGPVLGAFILVPVEDYIASAFGHARLFTGILLIVVTLVSRGGLLGMLGIRGFR